MKELLERISKLKVLVIGDIILDHYIWGDASRLSQEAPVPVIAVRRDTYAVGGAGNVAVNLKALGVKTAILGTEGGDEAGDRLREMITGAGVERVPMPGRDGAPSILKTRVVGGGQQICRIDREERPERYNFGLEASRSNIVEAVRNADAVIFSDYGKGIITDGLIEIVRQTARQEGVFISYDPKPRRLMQFAGMDLMTPNRMESLELAGIPFGLHEDFPGDAVCASIFARYAPRNLVITLGGQGMLISAGGGTKESIPTYAREVFDVSGAGDTVIATLTCALCSGASIEQSAHFANTAAGVVVAKLGTASASPEEILAHNEAVGRSPKA